MVFFCTELLKLKLSLVGFAALILNTFDLNMFSFLEHGDSMWSVGELYFTPVQELGIDGCECLRCVFLWNSVLCSVIGP